MWVPEGSSRGPRVPPWVVGKALLHTEGLGAEGKTGEGILRRLGSQSVRA